MMERRWMAMGRAAALWAVALAAACGRVEESGLALEPYENRGSFGAVELELAPEREHRLVISGVPPETERLDVVFDLTGLEGAVLALVEGAAGRDTPVRAVALPGRPVMVQMRPGKDPVRVTLVGADARELPVRVVVAALRELPRQGDAGRGGSGETPLPETVVVEGGGGGGGDGDGPVDLLERKER